MRVAEGYPVPNMGWCATSRRASHPVLEGLDEGAWFYYLHSYAVPVSEYTLACAHHADEFSAVMHKDNFIAAQFHPERSS
ncbi:imidazole glycerol phosphate synthase subunit HisH, partial [Enterococcus hirae]